MRGTPPILEELSSVGFASLYTSEQAERLRRCVKRVEL